MFPEITSKGQKVSLEIKLGCNLKNKKNYNKEKAFGGVLRQSNTPLMTSMQNGFWDLRLI